MKKLLQKSKKGFKDEDVILQYDTDAYLATNRVLFGLFGQISVVLLSSISVTLSMVHLLQFPALFYGYFLEYVPVLVVSFSVLVGFVLSVYQFQAVLSIRSSSIIESKHGLLAVALFGLFVAVQDCAVGGLLFGFKGQWINATTNNYEVLLKAAAVNPLAAQELNSVHSYYSCCGTETIKTEHDVPVRIQALAPFFDYFVPLLGPAIRASKNVPFSCCNPDSPSFYCMHLQLDDVVKKTSKKMRVFPPRFNVTRGQAMDSIRANSDCPRTIYEAIKWEFFIFNSIAFISTGVWSLLVSLLTIYTHFYLRKRRQFLGVKDLIERIKSLQSIQSALPPQSLAVEPTQASMDSTQSLEHL